MKQTTCMPWHDPLVIWIITHMQILFHAACRCTHGAGTLYSRLDLEHPAGPEPRPRIRFPNGKVSEPWSMLSSMPHPLPDQVRGTALVSATHCLRDSFSILALMRFESVIAS
jgi:hypothetical protein